MNEPIVLDNLTLRGLLQENIQIQEQLRHEQEVNAHLEYQIGILKEEIDLLKQLLKGSEQE